MKKNPMTHSTGPRPHHNSNAGRGAIALLTLFCLLAMPAAATAQSGVPAAINYQGKLTDNLGDPVASGYYEVSFRIWDHPTQAATGNFVWGRTFPLNVVANGMFNVLLTDDGSSINVPGTPKSATLLQAFEGPSRYLGLTVKRNPQGAVGSPAEISPRQQLVTAPYAIHAYTATLADHAGYATNAAYALAAAAGSAGSQFNASSGLLVTGPSALTGNLSVTGQTTLNGNLNVQDSTTIGGGFVPVGGIIMWSGTTAPVGWALCNGQTYNGVVTPDLRGRFVLASGSGTGLTPRAVGDAPGGEETHVLTINEIPSHTHTNRVDTLGYVASHNQNKTVASAPGQFGSGNGYQTFESQHAGGGAAHNNMPPYYVLAFIIRLQ